ncbi:hypothetical protein [Flavobacterium sp. S87F.05.LMB.W.Kidney.N]|uniref:hypothetical protein n=1 Tax=Flavobacterium sp. S87F.05.LMB.W.Kidney.N TaxID=1278758 RepID=UPI0010655118|nr:hypothetical protein [Flavobacterium sp. S87F.05.LMB.W.Kidney.N]TDX11694.1 SprB-like repeat protein [Flavobacterium sp. S87F.05.LMB.W.Kidney.N]
MKTKLLSVLFLFFGLIHFTNAQTKYGMLVKTTLDPFQGWNGSHAGNLRISIGSQSISKGSNTTDDVVVAYKFLYITDNPTQIVCSSSTAGNKDGSDCNLDRNIPYNKDTFDSGYFGGCIGDAEMMGIYLPQPVNTNVCKNDVISLTRGWNWQYSYDAVNWTNFASSYQAKRAISFTMAALGGSDGKTKFYVRAGYDTTFTDYIIYDIIPCPPGLVGAPLVSSTTCVNNNDGKVVFTYDRDLVSNERFEFSFYKKPDNILIATPALTIDSVNRKLNFSGLAAGDYSIKYQTFIGAQPTSTNPTPDPAFTIPAATPFYFQITELQPQCNNQQGKIKLTASGGIAPYYYKIDSNAEVQFTSPTNEIDVTYGEHSIKVRDTNSCIDLTADQ